MARAYIFDAYGTLFDVHAAIARHRAAAGADAERFSELWRAKQLEYTWTLTLAGHYVDFWGLTERALDYAFARVPSVDRGLRPKLLDAYLTLDAFPGARAVLADLKTQGARLAILSNGSPRCSAPQSKRPVSPRSLTPSFPWTPRASTSRGLKSTRSPPTRWRSDRQTPRSCHQTAGT